MKTVETFRAVNALVPDADALAGTVTTDEIRLAGCSEVVFVLSKGAGALGTSTLTIEVCDDVSGTNATAVPFLYRVSTDSGETYGDLTEATTAGFTTTAGANQTIQLWAPLNAAVSSEQKPFIRMKSVEVVDDPVDAGVVALLLDKNLPFIGAVFS